MRLTVQRRLAAEILKCSPKRVAFEESSLETIKESITKADVRALINSGIITQKPIQSASRGRARVTATQKAKGRQKGHGSRKGTSNARASDKESWINKVRVQREYIKTLRDKKMITTEVYHMLYGRVKGGFFRNKRHVKLYLDERALITKAVEQSKK